MTAIEPFDVEITLADDVETPKREAKEAAGPRRTLDLDRVLDPDAADRQAANKAVAMMRRAMKSLDLDPAAAARVAFKAFEAAPELAAANHVMALALDKLGHLSKAIDFYERAVARDPENPEIFHNIALVAWKLDMMEHAEKFNRMALRLEPGRRDTLINLAGCLRDQGHFDKAVELLRAAIYETQEDHVLWNAMGTVLLEAGDPEQAKVFYEEAIRLDPTFARAWHNLGYARSLAGEQAAALAAYDKCAALPMPPGDRAHMLHGRALSRLGLGEIKEGWEDYAIRLDPAYPPGTLFRIEEPRWDGRWPIRNKRMLLVGEQGLGDEVLFLSVVPDLLEALGPEGELLIACEPRLQGLIQRSFPNVIVGPHATVRREGRDIRAVTWLKKGQIDLWAPMGGPLASLRPDLKAFGKGAAYLAPDPEKSARVEAALAALPPGPKVGLCWKSNLMTVKRMKYFSPFDAWAPVLGVKGVTFVSMQYGDTGPERAEAERRFGATIHEIPDLDLMNDLDGVAAAGAALDLTLGPMNASTNLAAAAGGEVWVVASPGHWPLLGAHRLPWYAKSQAFTPETYGDWGPTMRAMANALSEQAEKRRAA